MKTLFAWTLLLTGVGIFPALAGNQVLLRNLDPADGTPSILAADGSGHLFVLLTFPVKTGLATRVVKLDLNGARLASLDLPQMVSPVAAIPDAQGNLVVAGSDATFQGLILKLDAQLHGTLSSKSLPGSVRAMTLDAAGNIYLTGVTGSATFPVTPGAYQTKPPGKDNFGVAGYAFVTKLSPDAGQVLYSTYFGDDATNCIGGSSCVGAFGSTIGTAIALDTSGGIVISGMTNAWRLPTTPGALATTCVCAYRAYGGFAAKFQPTVTGAQQLQWSTFLNAGAATPYSVAVAVNSIALDAQGNVIVAGSAPPGLPTTAGTIQPSVIPLVGTADSGGFLIKLNSTGSTVVWGTYFGGSPFSYVKTVRVDAQGRVLFTGVTIDPALPANPNFPAFRPTYVARLSSDGATLVDSYQGPFGAVGQDLTITSTGGFAAVGQSRTLWIETANAGPSLLVITNSGSGLSTSSVAPVELVTLYGVGIGPQAPANGQLENGAFTTTLGGAQVLFDNIAAPLLYADSGQINAVVPRGVGASTHIRVVTPSGTVDGPTLPVVSYVPGIFQDGKTGMAAALNQDGSVNSTSNPARTGSIVTIFATGAGANYSRDGGITPIGIYSANATVWVGGTTSYEVDFAGDAPGLVSGVTQINFRVPDTLPPGNILPINILINWVLGSPSQIAVAP